MLDYEALGERIRAARKARGMTQCEFAKTIKRSLSFLGHIERGTRKLSLETFCEIAKALDMSANELLGIEKASHEKELCARELIETALSLVKEMEKDGSLID